MRVHPAKLVEFIVIEQFFVEQLVIIFVEFIIVLEQFIFIVFEQLVVLFEQLGF